MQGSKRSRTGITDSYGQAAAMQDGYIEINNDQAGSQWDWDDDDRGIVMDIQALLSEFGDFGDFFVNDALPFGEVIKCSFSYSFCCLYCIRTCFLN